MTEIIDAFKNKKWLRVLIFLIVFSIPFLNEIMTLMQNTKNYLTPKDEKAINKSELEILSKRTESASSQLNINVSPMKPEDALSRLNTNLSLEYAKSIFGMPIIQQNIENSKCTECIYSFKNFYLQLVSNENNIIIFYAITVKDKRFQPTIPYLNAKIGKVTFEEATDGASYQTLYNNVSSKFYEYGESTYLGNPSNYKKIYLAYNPSGIDFNGNTFMSIDELEDKDKIKDMRSKSLPNTYAVGSSAYEENSIINSENLHIGVDYFTARDLPTS